MSGHQPVALSAELLDMDSGMYKIPGEPEKAAHCGSPNATEQPRGSLGTGC